MSGIWVSRSDAVSSADNVAQLLDLREIAVPEKSHDSGAQVIHSFLRCGCGWKVREVSAGFCRALGPASVADVGGGLR